ncbi:general transcription factor II-I-like isoform X1 [Girardinichthys multiradiatus]|uniref:general transcription factor II-I-like isoform X1 n=1 Tax=Girardinichthys multiradiatus TaxID=208333 RepID=UPI001FAD4B67|nr:general transcription factor II-I-like isoform X1 [Girardinichthys multiradiatus]XP_047206237.1 general transcription factor II-I-like isoform X1 [Girardinichthys multiradiatus]
MLFYCQKPNLEVLEVSSKGAAAFLDSTETLSSFALHFKGSSSSASAAKETVDALVKKVQEVFNQKYNDAGGSGRLPYQSLQNHSIIINASGLPNGLTLKKPSHYGRKQLFLKAAEQISFHIDVQSVEEAVQTCDIVVMTANILRVKIRPKLWKIFWRECVEMVSFLHAWAVPDRSQEGPVPLQSWS